MTILPTAFYAFLLVIPSIVHLERIVESLRFDAGTTGTTYDLYNYIKIERKLTVMAWVGVSKLSSVGIWRIESPTGHLSVSTGVQNGLPTVFLENTYGSSDSLALTQTNIDTKNWARVAISFEINTVISKAYLFVEQQRSSIDNLLASTNGAYLLLGSNEVSTRAVGADMAFLELTFFTRYIDLLSSDQDIEAIFEFEPNPNILIQVYKHGPYTKRYFNHMLGYADVTAGDETSYGVPGNIYSSLESLGSGLRLYPKDSYRGMVDQSYMVVIRLDLFYQNTALTSQRYLHRLTLHSRATSANALIFENVFKLNYSSITNINGVPNIEFKNAVSTANDIDLYSTNLPLQNTINKLPIKIYVIKVRKTVLDTQITISIVSDLMGTLKTSMQGSLLDSDYLYIGSSNSQTSYKFLNQTDQMGYLKIYEVLFFQNSFTDWRKTEADKIKAGLSGSMLILDCDAAVEGIKRVSLATPYNVAYNSCVPETYVSVCSLSNCNICEGSTCYDCKIGYELNGGACVKCLLANNLVYDPYLRSCLPFKSSLSSQSGLSQYTLNADPASYGLSYRAIQITEVYETRLTLRASLSSVANPAQYKLFFDGSPIQNYNIFQFLDSSIVDEDGFVYISLDIPDVNGIFKIQSSASFSISGHAGGISHSISKTNSHFKNFSCYRSSPVYYYKTSFNTVSCETVCNGTEYVDSSQKCTSCSVGCSNCTSLHSCSVCATGYFLTNGSCLKCSNNCATCSNTRDNCLTCAGDSTLKFNTSIGYCSVDAATAIVDEVAQNIVDQNLISTDLDDSACGEGSYYDDSTSICITCRSGCSSCVNYSVCTSCINGYLFVSGRCISKIDTGEQEPVLEIEDSEVIIENCEQQLGAMCLICTEGGLKNSDFKCEICSSQCEECVSTSDCSSCTSHFDLTNGTCVRADEDSSVYLDNGEYTNCLLCDNCFDCPICSECTFQIQYSVVHSVNTLTFTFPEDVVLLDDIQRRVSTPLTGISSIGNSNKDQALLSRRVAVDDQVQEELGDGDNGNNLATSFDTDYFIIETLNCDTDIQVRNTKVSNDNSSIQFTFEPQGRYYECYFSIKLKDPIIKSVRKGVLIFQKHFITLRSVSNDRSDQLLTTTATTATKVVVVTFALNNTKAFNALVFYVSSINILNLFLLTQYKYYRRIANILSSFMLNFEIKIKLKQDSILKSFYDARFIQKHIVPDVLEGEYFNLLDLRILFVILTFVLQLARKYIPMSSKIVNNCCFVWLTTALESFSFAYVTSESFIFIFRRILLYRYLDVRHVSWGYFMGDKLLILIISYGVYKTVQIHTSVSQKFSLKEKYTGLMMYYHPEVRYSQFYTTLLFLRNIGLAIVIIYARSVPVALGVLVNLILLLFILYTLRLVVRIREIDMGINLGTDFVLLCLFNIIQFYNANNVLDHTLLFCCLGISSGFMSQAMITSAKSVELQSILKFF